MWSLGAHQVPLSMGSSKQEFWSGYHFLLKRIFLTEGSNPGVLYYRQSLPSVPPGKCSGPYKPAYIRDFYLFSLNFFRSLMCGLDTCWDVTMVSMFHPPRFIHWNLNPGDDGTRGCGLLSLTSWGLHGLELLTLKRIKRLQIKTHCKMLPLWQRRN